MVLPAKGASQVQSCIFLEIAVFSYKDDSNDCFVPVGRWEKREGLQQSARKRCKQFHENILCWHAYRLKNLSA
jgi:hypothetical protein